MFVTVASGFLLKAKNEKIEIGIKIRLKNSTCWDKSKSIIPTIIPPNKSNHNIRAYFLKRMLLFCSFPRIPKELKTIKINVNEK